MKKHNMLLIANPVAGRGKIRRDLLKIVKNFKKAKFKVCVKYTCIDYTATDIIMNYNKPCDVIIVLGGDGTLNEVVTGLTKSNKKINVGFIPLGTTNDFAKSLKIKKNRTELSKNILNRMVKNCDTGKINDDKYFNYVAAFGVFTETAYGTSRKSKKILGRLAYIINGFKELFRIKKHKATIYANDEVITDDFIYGGISNSNSIAGFELYNQKEVDLSDGKFEAMFIRMPKNFFKKVKLGFDLLFKNRKNPDIICFQVSKIVVEIEEPVNWTMDGEFAGKYSKVKIENLPKNIGFLV